MKAVINIVLLLLIGYGAYWGSISLYPPMANIIASPKGYNISAAIIVGFVGIVFGLKAMKVIK